MTIAVPPLLLLAYNRPATTARVMDAIRTARPERFFVAIDGPRPDRPDDAGRCAEVRRIATAVDWPCTVHTRFLDVNHGCRRAVSGAIGWFFDQVPAGIILEDDCLPHPTFFAFCSELLQRYAETPPVMLIAGYNPHPGRRCDAASYHFSRYPIIWGWASWRRAWRFYDDDPQALARNMARAEFRRRFHHAGHRAYFQDRFQRTFDGRIDSWGYIWFYSVLCAGGLAAHPNTNLVENIGLGPGATHTRRIRRSARAEAGPMAFPLKHPLRLAADRDADRALFRRVHCPSLALFFLAQVYRRLRPRQVARRLKTGGP